MQIISALAWPFVALVAIGAVLIIARSFHNAIVQAVTERPVKLAVGIGKVRATAETWDRDRIAEHGKLVDAKPSEREVQKQVDSKLFVLRDEGGRERAKLGVTDTDATSLSLYDAQGKERISIFVLADGSSSVALYDDKGLVRTMLSRGETAEVDGLTILGPDRKNGIYLLVSSEGHPSFDISDQRGLAVFGA